MSRASRQEWSKRVERWRDSGLTAQEFAAEVGVNPQTLSCWKWKLKSDAKTNRVTSARGPSAARALPFVEIAASATSAAWFEVVLGAGVVVRVPSQFDAAALGQLLDVLGHRS